MFLSAEEEEEEEEEDENEVKDRSQPRWRVWLDVESSREAAQWLPWRPDKAKGQSEEDCEDPDRQVLLGSHTDRNKQTDRRKSVLLYCYF